MASITTNDIENGSTDNCGIDTMYIDRFDFTCEDLGTHRVTLTVVDHFGQTSTCVALVTVEENPEVFAISCVNLDVYLDENGNASVSVDELYDGHENGCFDRLLDVPVNFRCNDLDTNWVEITARSLTGDQATCTAAVVVHDTLPPTAVCTNITVQLNSLGMAEISIDDFVDESYDNCGIDSMVMSPSSMSFDCNSIGESTITFTYWDRSGNKSECTSTVTVADDALNCFNEPPIAENDINTTMMDTPVSGQVLTNDSDPDGDPLTVNTTPISGPTNGTVVLNSDGTYTYTPDPGFTGNDSFTYEVCDPSGLCDQAIVTISVIAADDGTNRPPIAIDDNYTGKVDTPVSGSLLPNDSDPDGDNITINTTPVTPPATGTLTINPDGTFDYIPEPGFTGEVTFEYEICDDGSPVLCDIATVTIEILDIPADVNTTVGVDDAYFTRKDVPITGDVSDNDYDPEGDTQVSFTVVSGPSNGTLTFNTDGSFTYVPNPGFNGNDSFVYEVCDNGTPVACDMATAHITVEGVNEPPIIDCLSIGNKNVGTDKGGDTYTHNSMDWDVIAYNSIGQEVETTYILSGATTGGGTSLDGVAFQIGVTTVQWIASDQSGNTVSCSFTVKVYDGVDPGITYTSGYSCEEKENEFVETDMYKAFYTNFGSDWDIKVTDNNGGEIICAYELSGVTTGSGISLDGIQFNIGETTVSWTATDNAGNSTVCIFIVTVIDACKLFIPNGFSPNDDGINDYFKITCLHNYPDARIEIYNRWGNIVYEQENYGNTDRWGDIDAWWGGYSNHKWTWGANKLPIGTYFYILEFNDGISDSETGFIFLNSRD